MTAAALGAPGYDMVRSWYDGLGRPATILSYMSGQPRYLNHQYDLAGNREHLTHTNDNVRFRYFHDGLGRVTHVTDNPNVASADDYVIRYFYRPEGPRYVAIRGAGAGGFTTAYHYDPLQRLAMMANDLPDTANDMTVTLAYNPASQIRHYERDNNAYAWTGSAAVTGPYTVNGQNQYLSAGDVNFNYDANGNLIWNSASNYVYDVENRLISSSGEKNAHLTYDPLGRLAQVNGAAGVTRFHYDGDQLIAEYDYYGALLRRYVHGPGTDEPVAVYEGSALGLANRRYMLPDERGSVAALVNANGTPSAINTYDEYGIPGAGNQGRFQYTGQTWIPELGMYYYKARIYSPTLGRFLQTDLIGYDDQINLYAYVANDPVNATDPTGEKSYVAARPLESAAGSLGYGHAYVAVNARYPGDPRARIISFGPLQNGKMGNVSDRSRAAAMAVATAASDRKAWLGLAPNAKSNIVQINAPDAVISSVANSLKENRPYSMTPSSSQIQLTGKAAGYPTPEVNSNSAAFAVGNEAQKRAAGSPSIVSRDTFTLKLPGASASGKVDFHPEKER